MTVLIRVVAYANSQILLKEFFEKNFSRSPKNSMGMDFYLREVERDSKRFKLQIWAFSKSSMHSTYFLGALAGIILFDLSNPQEFETLGDRVSDIWNHNGRGIIPIIVIGYKGEINAQYTFVSQKADLIKEIKIPYSRDSIIIFLNENSGDFSLGLFKDKVESKSIIIKNNTSEDEVVKILIESPIDFIGMSPVYETTQEILTAINDASKSYETRKQSKESSGPKSMDIETLTVKYCKKLSEQTLQHGFEVKFYTYTKNQDNLFPLFDEYIISNYVKLLKPNPQEQSK